MEIWQGFKNAITQLLNITLYREKNVRRQNYKTQKKISALYEK